MTIPPSAYRRDAALPPSPSLRLPAVRVRGEIKPHNATGIRAGLLQLLRAPSNTRRILITYRTIADADPTRFEVLLADPDDVTSSLSALQRRPPGPVRLTRWYRIGTFTAPQATQRIPLWSCATALGTAVEPHVRAAYVRFRARSGDAVTLSPHDPHASGHDIVHEELADFLGELASDLAGGMRPGPARAPGHDT